MKKFFKMWLSIVITGILAISIGSCNSSNNQFQTNLKNDVDKYHKDIKEIISQNQNSDENELLKKIRDYLKKENFKAKKSYGTNVIIQFEGDANDNNTAKRIFNVSLSKDRAEESSQAIATILATVKNTENHGDIKIIISYENDGYKFGIDKLPKSEFEGYDFINLVSDNENSIALSSPGTEVYSITKTGKKSKPKGEVAYRISIKGLKSIDSGNRTEKHANPITNLGGILLRAKNADINVEIIDFKSQGDIHKYPTEGYIDVVIEKGSQEKFEGRLQKAKEEFIEKNQELNPDAKFEYSPIPMPKYVYTYESTTDLLSLIYTLEDGVFATSDRDYKGDIEALATIVNVKTENKNLELTVMARGINSEIIKLMRENFKMTSKILGFTMSYNDRIPLWKKEKENEDYWKKSGIYSLFNKSTAEGKDLFIESPCSVVYSKNNSLKIVELRFNFKELKKVGAGLERFLKKSDDMIKNTEK